MCGGKGAREGGGEREREMQTDRWTEGGVVVGPSCGGTLVTSMGERMRDADGQTDREEVHLGHQHGKNRKTERKKKI